MNYILLFPDELRAESLGCYGHPLVKTPNIDALAEEGTIFRNNYSAHPVCVASRCSLVSGWYPHVKGYRNQQNLMPAEESNMIRPLNEAGFVTALAGKDDVFKAEDLTKVFQGYFPFGGATRPLNDGNKHYTMIMPPTPQEKADLNIDYVANEDAIGFIRARAADGEPYFLWVNYLAPHPPYTCPEPWYDMYDPKDVPIARDKTWLENKPSLYRFCRDYREADEEPAGTFEKVNAIYLGMISWVDMLVGRIVQALKETGQYENTTIIFCSDHGDFAGDAELVEKCPNGLDDMLLKVPLIIRRPGEKHHDIKAFTQSIDIMPTILDLEGIEPGYDQFGCSLKKEITEGREDPDRVVYSEGGYDTREPQCFETFGSPTSLLRKVMGPGTIYYPKLMHQTEQPDSVCRSIMRRDSRYKIVLRTNGEHELYDMQEDPLEFKNLYGKDEYAGIFSELTLKTMLWLLHTSDSVPRTTVKPWFEKT